MNKDQVSKYLEEVDEGLIKYDFTVDYLSLMAEKVEDSDRVLSVERRQGTTLIHIIRSLCAPHSLISTDLSTDCDLKSEQVEE